MSTSTSTSPSIPARYDFLDWLRVVAIFLLLFFHTGMLFVGWGWHITNDDTMPWLQIPMDIAHRLRMPLLFVIAGAGMWYALQRRGLGTFTKERAMRLLLPLAAGMLLIVPPQVYVERVMTGAWDGGYFAFLFERVFRFLPYPEGDFSWHHLWFIAYLFVYALILLPFMAWWRRTRPTVKPGLWWFALGLPLGINEALVKPHFPETHALINDWYIFVHYLLLTIYGFVLASAPGAWDWLAAQRRRALGATLTILVGGLTLIEMGVIVRGTAVDSVLANVFTWLALMTFLGYGRQHLSRDNRLLRWARDASYPVYILHQTVIIVVAAYVITRPWSAGVKYWIVWGATVAISVAGYEIIRRVGVLRVLFGLKAERKSRGAISLRTSRTAAS